MLTVTEMSVANEIRKTKQAYEGKPEAQRAALSLLQEDLAALLAYMNPRFDRDRFNAACEG
jgi:hypothetical protein